MDVSSSFYRSAVLPGQCGGYLRLYPAPLLSPDDPGAVVSGNPPVPDHHGSLSSLSYVPLILSVQTGVESRHRVRLLVCLRQLLLLRQRPDRLHRSPGRNHAVHHHAGSVPNGVVESFVALGASNRLHGRGHAVCHSVSRSSSKCRLPSYVGLRISIPCPTLRPYGLFCSVPFRESVE